MTPTQKTMIFAGLAAAMAATRMHHFGPLPDASWAIFFAAGFYLKGWLRGVFPVLMAQAMLLDWIATQHLGVSAYCITPAYWAIWPGYGVLALGGYWLRTHYQHRGRDFARLVASLGGAVSICYWITNGAFYWFGGRIASPNFAEYLDAFVKYLPHFMQVSFAYAAFFTVLHLVFSHLAQLRAGTRPGAER